MSKFEDYDEKSRDYNKFRISHGKDVVAALVTMHTDKKKQDLRVLDAGCGTGNPAKILLEYGFQHLTLMDASSGMLKLAREKLNKAITDGNVENIVQAHLPQLPFPDKCFDVVMFSLVLHHLDNNNNFNEVVETLKEAHRTMTDDGTLAVISPLPYGILEGVWWTQLVPEITKRYVKKLPSVSQWNDIFGRSRFRYVNILTILGCDLYGPLHLDMEGHLNKEWMNSISYFTIATVDEIKEIEDKINKMKEDGTLEQWIRDHDKTNEIGTVGVIICKPGH